MALKHFKTQLEYFKISLKTALDYRASFIIQTVSMILNDIVWIIFWLIIFNKFQNINGWNLNDMILLYAVILTSYGIGGVFYGNRRNISSIIVEGRLDYYLTLPKNILYHVIISKASWYSLGDLLLGIVLAIMFIPLVKAPLFILLIVLSAIIFISFDILTGSLAFFMENSEETSSTLREGLIAFSSYPLSIYTGLTKILILFIIPAGFVSGIPVQLLKTFDATWLMYTIGFTIVLTIVAVSLFYIGLKKYESGNQLYVRT